MAITINGVVCQELVHGFSETVDIIDGPQARKGYLCNWTDRYTVARGLMGLTSASVVGGTVTVSYPSQYPQISTIYAHSISFEPKGPPLQSTPQLTWSKCVVWAEYARLPFFANVFNQIDPSRPLVYAEQRIGVSVEWLTIPKQFALFKTSLARTGQDVGIRLALVEMEIRFPQLPYMPSDTAINSAGLINDAPYLGVATGHLIFNGVTTQTTTLYDGSYSQEGVYSFTARSQRWDYAFDGYFNRWDQVVWKDGSTPFIATTSFDGILPDYVVG